MSEDQPNPLEPKPSTETPTASSEVKASPPTEEKATQSTSKLQVFLRMVGQIWGILLALLPIVVALLRQLWKLLVQAWKGLQAVWSVALPRVRSLLPEAWNAKLSDSALTGIAVGIVLISLWFTSALWSLGHPSVVAKTPSSPENQIAEKTLPIEPTPDPNRIAAIQDQLAEVTNRYSEALIHSVQANFLRSQLTVNVSDDWYSLEPDLQNRLADEVLWRSRKLDFTELDLVDAAGTLLARSPVVGKSMVVYTRVRDEV